LVNCTILFRPFLVFSPPSENFPEMFGLGNNSFPKLQRRIWWVNRGFKELKEIRVIPQWIKSGERPAWMKVESTPDSRQIQRTFGVVPDFYFSIKIIIFRYPTGVRWF